MPTVIMGAAKDIVEHCGVPRFLFSDFPLGNSAGKPFDVESQAATLELALLGADVIKVESRDGDETRSQLIASKWAERKMPPGFLAVNGNKRSITLDLRKPEAIQVVNKLVRISDVVWENFRPGVMDKL